MCLLADLTLMLAWNADEAGKIVETYKMFESKPPDLIMARTQQYPHQKVRTAKVKWKKRYGKPFVIISISHSVGHGIDKHQAR